MALFTRQILMNEFGMYFHWDASPSWRSGANLFVALQSDATESAIGTRDIELYSDTTGVTTTATTQKTFNLSSFRIAGVLHTFYKAGNNAMPPASAKSILCRYKIKTVIYDDVTTYESTVTSPDWSYVIFHAVSGESQYINLGNTTTVTSTSVGIALKVKVPYTTSSLTSVNAETAFNALLNQATKWKYTISPPSGAHAVTDANPSSVTVTSSGITLSSGEAGNYGAAYAVVQFGITTYFPVSGNYDITVKFESNDSDTAYSLFGVHRIVASITPQTPSTAAAMISGDGDMTITITVSGV